MGSGEDQAAAVGLDEGTGKGESEPGGACAGDGAVEDRQAFGDTGAVVLDGQDAAAVDGARAEECASGAVGEGVLEQDVEGLGDAAWADSGWE